MTQELQSTAWLKTHKDSPFHTLKEAVLGRLVSSARPIQYRAGELLFQEGSFAAGLYLIQEGLILYGKCAGDRRHQCLLSIFGPGQLLGLETLCERFACENPCRARALRDAKVLFLDRRKLFSLGQKHPALLRALLGHVAKELVLMECRFVESAYASLEKNLARLLVSLGRRYGMPRAEGLAIDLKLSREDLAQMLGKETSTIVRALTRFKRRGLLGPQHRRLLLLDLPALEQEALPKITCMCL